MNDIVSFFQIRDLATTVEILLVAVLVALIGAAVYVFFINSMRNDRQEEFAKRFYSNPWDDIGANNRSDISSDPPRSKSDTVYKIFLLTAISIVSFLILAINKGWILN